MQRYPPGAHLARHHHDRASLTLMLEGSQRESIGLRHFDCTVDSAVLKGGGIEHSNAVGAGGARGLFVEMPADTEAALCQAAGEPLGGRYFADGATRHLVQRIGRGAHGSGR